MSSIIIIIQSGEGGKDSKLFVDDLKNLYLKYASKIGLKSQILQHSDGYVKLQFDGKLAPKAFKNESGKHVVQRVPPTESKGRYHTSTISVAVMNPREIVDGSLDMNEVSIITQRGHGSGGQHQNKTDSAVRATHVPTGISVFINGRKQKQNKIEALTILTDRVNRFYGEKIDCEYDENRRKQMGGGSRSDKVRTYNFINSRVVDHRLGTRTTKIDKVMRGNLDLIVGDI